MVAKNFINSTSLDSYRHRQVNQGVMKYSQIHILFIEIQPFDM